MIRIVNNTDNPGQAMFRLTYLLFILMQHSRKFLHPLSIKSEHHCQTFKKFKNLEWPNQGIE